MSTFEQVTEQAKAACAAYPGVTYTVHPAWCDDTDCRGEHNGTVRPEYLPATEAFRESTTSEGHTFPQLGALAWDTLDQLDPCVLEIWQQAKRVDQPECPVRGKNFDGPAAWPNQPRT